MTGIDPYSNPRRGGLHIRHGAERQPPSPRVDDSIDPYSNPRRGGFHIRPHYAVPRMWGAASSTLRNTQHTQNIKEHP